MPTKCSDCCTASRVNIRRQKKVLGDETEVQNEESKNSYFLSVTDRGEQEAYNWTEGDRFARCQVDNLDINPLASEFPFKF